MVVVEQKEWPRCPRGPSGRQHGRLVFFFFLFLFKFFIFSSTREAKAYDVLCGDGSPTDILSFSKGRLVTNGGNRFRLPRVSKE